MTSRRWLLTLGLLFFLEPGATPAQSPTCLQGATAGTINVPVGNIAGFVLGDLTLQDGTIAWHLQGTLVPPPLPFPTAPAILDGRLEPAPPLLAEFRVRGRVFSDPVTGQGFFRAVVLTVAPKVEVVGRIGGAFNDPPDPNQAGAYAGKWILCP